MATTVERSAVATPDRSEAPAGLGGWLYAPLALLVLSPLATAWGTAATARRLLSHEVWIRLTDPAAPGHVPGAGWLACGQVAINAVSIGFALVCLAAMLRRSRRFPGLMIAFLVTVITLKLADGLAASLVIDNAWDSAAWIDLAATGLAAALGIAYLRRSKRVAATFTA